MRILPIDRSSGSAAKPRSARPGRLLALGWALLGLALLVASANAAHTPALEAKDLNGTRQSLASLRGKIVVLNFWATWCAPCREELPRLSALAQHYAGQPVEFIAVSIDEPKDRPKIQPLLAKRDVTLTVWTGPNADILDRFGLGVIVPATIVLDPQGQPVSRIMGEAREEDVRAPVDWLLGGGKGDAPKPLVKRY